MIVCAALITLSNLVAYLGHDKITVIHSMAGNRMPLISMMILSIVFCTRDFSTGYVKNIYVSVNKFFYILSKTVILFTFSVALFAYTFVTEVIFNYALNIGVVYIYEPGNTLKLGTVVAEIFMEIFGVAVAGMWVLLLSVICKRIFVVAIVGIAYPLGLNQYLYDLINVVVHSAANANADFNFDIANYSVLANIDQTMGKLPPDFLRYGIVFLCFGVVALFASWLVFAKKNY